LLSGWVNKGFYPLPHEYRDLLIFIFFFGLKLLENYSALIFFLLFKNLNKDLVDLILYSYRSIVCFLILFNFLNVLDVFLKLSFFFLSGPLFNPPPSLSGLSTSNNIHFAASSSSKRYLAVFIIQFVPRKAFASANFDTICTLSIYPYVHNQHKKG